MRSRRKRFPWRSLLYLAILAYLVGDLHFFEGPIRRKIDSRNQFTRHSRHRAIENGWVATVNAEPITVSQLDRACQLHLFRRKKREATLSPFDRHIARRAALQGLIIETLVRQYTVAEHFAADPEAVRKHIETFEAQFTGPEELEARSEEQQLTPEKRNALLAEHLSQYLWIEKRIQPAVNVTEAEMREWFEKNRSVEKASFTHPELIRARHLFLSTVEEDTPEREQLIQDLHRQLTEENAEFAELAARFSEDERTKHKGGDLNWFARERMPKDFCDVVFRLEEGALSQPFRTTIGWHIAMVTGRQAARPVTFEEVKAEIRSLLEMERRRYAIETLLHKLQIASAIEVFPENLDRSPETP